jgi:hypothetical protein
MELLDLASFRPVWESWGMRWEPGEVVPRFASVEPESPWSWPKADGHTRPWELANLIVDALKAATPNQTGGFYLVPPYGHWWPGDGDSYYRIRDAILTSLGIPLDFEGVAHFSHAETDRLAAAVFARCFMVDDRQGSAADDVFVYPSHGRLYLHFDDEEITWGMAATGQPLQEFDQELERLGWAWLRDKERTQLSWYLTYQPSEETAEDS